MTQESGVQFKINHLVVTITMTTEAQCSVGTSGDSICIRWFRLVELSLFLLSVNGLLFCSYRSPFEINS